MITQTTPCAGPRQQSAEGRANRRPRSATSSILRLDGRAQEEAHDLLLFGPPQPLVYSEASSRALERRLAEHSAYAALMAGNRTLGHG